MYSSGFYVPIIIFCLTTTITPGPNNLMIMTSGARFGIIKSLPHYLGICFGFSLMVFLVGIGLSKIFTLIPVLHVILKYVGTIFMLYLAYLITVSRDDFSVERPASRPLTFIQASLFQWVNPKAWIMSAGVFSAYSLQTGNLFIQAFIIAVIFLIACFPCIGSWMFFGVVIKKYLMNIRHQIIFNRIMGILLAISIIPVLFD
jgi:threonine/homoserine/homoserine lactone efflux protein